MRLDHDLRMGRNLRRAACVLAWLGGSLIASAPAAATDGSSVAPETYYEETLSGAATRDLASDAAGVPTALHVTEGSAVAEYRSSLRKDGRAGWDVRIRGFERNHERVDAVYDMVLVLPLPASASGEPAFEALQWGITPYEGSEAASVPLIYGGEKVTLKRNIALEKIFLPGLIGDPAQGRLPSLAGTGYQYTLWDSIIRFDPAFGARVQGWASFRYTTDATVRAPDAADPALAAYLVTWIPSLRSDVRPYAVRIDVRPPTAE